MLQKSRVRNVTPDRLVVQQLTNRLKRLRTRIAILTAEAEMIERMVADTEKFSTVPRLKLRSNSQGKWTVRGQVRSYLNEHTTSVKAQDMLEYLKKLDPTLNPSTFRSHLKRMVADGILVQEGDRGHYQLAPRHSEAPDREGGVRSRRSVLIRRDR